MATPKSQRIGIWIIAIVMTIGTLGSFLMIGLSINNQKIDQAAKDKLFKEFNQVMNKYQNDVTNQTKELSAKYYDDFNKYSSNVSEFVGSEVKELVKKDLVVGTGEEIKSDTQYSAYYIGWNPKGVIFDQSIKDGALLTPLTAGGGMIEGWNEGILGMKMGGVREITIPSDKAYGADSKGDNIPPNTPLKFIIMVIPKVEPIPYPDLTRFENPQY